MKRIVGCLGVIASLICGLPLAAGTSCIIEDHSVDEKYVATASAAGFDIVGMASVSKGAAMDLRSSTRDVTAAMTVDTRSPGLYIIIR